MNTLTRGHRLAPATLKIVMIVAVVALAIATAGAIYVGTRPVVEPVPPAVPSPAVISSPAAMPVCPPGTDPDRPGQADQDRPPGIRLAEWAGDTSILILPHTGPSPNWEFDVCTNTWLASPADSVAPDASGLVWVQGSNLLVAIGEGTGTRRPGGEWVDRGGPGRWGSQPGYDNAANMIFVRDPATGEMWTYDPDLDTWADVEQAEPMPPRQGTTAFVLATYDPSAARFVLLEGAHTRRAWLFDPRTSTWEEGAALPRTLDLFIQSDELAYDSVAGRSLVYANGRVFAFDARSQTWEILYEAGPDEDRFIRSAPGIAFDPVNERLVVMGGFILRGDGWVETDDVIAFDPTTQTWIELLAPSDGG